MSESQLRRIVTSGEYLIGYFYNESNYRALKKIAIETGSTPEVMVLGSSRVMQFRDFMFDKDFYNCGYTIVTINQFQEYLESMPESKLPRVLVVGLDQWMFNPNWAEADAKYATNFFDTETVRLAQDPKPVQIKSFWADAASGRIPLHEIPLNPSREPKQVVGLNAHLFGMGFREDGSFQYGAKVQARLDGDPTIQDFGFQDTFERIEKGVARFEYGSELNPIALQRLADLVEFCRVKQIRLVSFLPPFAPAVVQKLRESGRHTYMWRLPEELEEIVGGNHAEFWDFTDVSSLGLGDEAFIDGFHGGEYCYLNMLQYMVAHHSGLHNYVDSAILERLHSKSKNSLEVQ